MNGYEQEITKPVVTYHHLVGAKLHVGKQTHVAGIRNHPVLGDRLSTEIVTTSTVTQIIDAENGVFETLNTRYVPESPHYSG